MSVISGGIFSKPRGKTGGIVFGAARTRNGKLATARELVKPSNPNTALQQNQRTKFKSVLSLVRRIGQSIYKTAWNRSIGQLPGFQSMMSVFLGQIDDAFDITLVNNINLGALHFPDTFDVDSVDPGVIELSWSTENGSNGTQNDKIVVIAFAKTDANRNLANGVVISDVTARSTDALDLSGLISGETYELYLYVQGVGTAEGLFSIANSKSQLVA